jgi:hypothetical protein
MARRRITAEDLEDLGLEEIDPADLVVEIDPADLRRPIWKGVSATAGAAHRRALADKYHPEDLPDLDHRVVAAILERNEHPVLAERRREMMMRL